MMGRMGADKNLSLEDCMVTSLSLSDSQQPTRAMYAQLQQQQHQLQQQGRHPYQQQMMPPLPPQPIPYASPPQYAIATDQAPQSQSQQQPFAQQSSPKFNIRLMPQQTDRLPFVDELVNADMNFKRKKSLGASIDSARSGYADAANQVYSEWSSPTQQTQSVDQSPLLSTTTNQYRSKPTDLQMNYRVKYSADAGTAHQQQSPSVTFEGGVGGGGRVGQSPPSQSTPNPLTRPQSGGVAPAAIECSPEGDGSQVPHTSASSRNALNIHTFTHTHSHVKPVIDSPKSPNISPTASGRVPALALFNISNPSSPVVADAPQSTFASVSTDSATATAPTAAATGAQPGSGGRSDAEVLRYLHMILDPFNSGNMKDLEQAINYVLSDDCVMRTKVVESTTNRDNTTAGAGKKCISSAGDKMAFVDHVVARADIFSYFKALTDAFPDVHWKLQEVKMKKGGKARGLLANYLFKGTVTSTPAWMFALRSADVCVCVCVCGPVCMQARCLRQCTTARSTAGSTWRRARRGAGRSCGRSGPRCSTCAPTAPSTWCSTRSAASAPSTSTTSSTSPPCPHLPPSVNNVYTSPPAHALSAPVSQVAGFPLMWALCLSQSSNLFFN
jgi:hypothetical protein